MRGAAAFVLLLATAAACGRSGAVACQPFSARELDETGGGCLGPPVTVEGLNVCHDTSASPGHSTNPVCVVGPGTQGRVFVGRLSSTEWLDGAGWTHSAQVNEASTLSPADEARCAPALAPGAPTCP